MSFTIVYDLQDPTAWKRANRDRSLWGRLYVDASFLDRDHVILTFRPAPDQRWRAWEGARKRMILGARTAA